MPRQTVEDNEIIFRYAFTLDEAAQYGRGNVELVIFQQCSGSKGIPNDAQVFM